MRGLHAGRALLALLLGTSAASADATGASSDGQAAAVSQAPASESPPGGGAQAPPS